MPVYPLPKVSCYCSVPVTSSFVLLCMYAFLEPSDSMLLTSRALVPELFSAPALCRLSTMTGRWA